MTKDTDEASDPMRTVLADMLRFRLDKGDMDCCYIRGR